MIEKILVVDDEEMIRDIAPQFLKKVIAEYDIQVDTAMSGEEGYAMYMAAEIDKSGAYDLVLSDIVMGDMSGIDMYKELKHKGYEPNIIFMSGYTADNDVSAILDDDPNTSFIGKPFGLIELQAVISKYK